MKQNKVIISESENNQASYNWKWWSPSSSWKFSAKSEDIVSVRKSAKFVYWWTRLVLNGLASLEFSNCKFRILLTQKL